VVVMVMVMVIIIIIMIRSVVKDDFYDPVTFEV
jgi:hypothetical protein